MTADLHIHTNASDGLFSPQEILTKACAVGLTHIAITDHDTVDGLLSLQNNTPVPGQTAVIPGIEFATDLPQYEVHILGYFIDTAHSELNRQIKIIAANRQERAELMVHKLKKLGYPVNYQRVREIAGKATAIGRPHVAAALLEKGYFRNISEVFTTLLEKNKPAYIPHYKLSPQDTIALIKSADGIPVLAHPGLVNNDELVLEIIESGIQGIEVYHPRHSAEQISRYQALAEEHGLLLTGGSDFHGIAGRFPSQLGEYTIPDELVSRLLQSRHEQP